MIKSVGLLFIIVVLTASFIIVRPAFSSAVVIEDSWTSKAEIHVARSGLGVAVVNGKIYAIGGSSRAGAPPYTGGAVGINEEYDPETDKWTLKAQMPTPRYNFRTEVVHNKIYCIGGYTDGLMTTNAVEVYDPSTDTWETIDPFPTPRESFTTVVNKNRIYVIGGIAGRDLPNEERGNYTGVTEVYDPVLDKWETKASMPDFRFPESCDVINGKIHVISGSTTYYESISITSVYDIATNSWTNKASMPFVKIGKSIIINDKIYFIGGSYEDEYYEDYVTRLQIYDPATDKWSEGARPTYGAVVHAVATKGEVAPVRIYILDNFNVLRIYDPEKDVWTLGANKTVDRLNMGVAVLKDKIYAIGGNSYIHPGLLSVIKQPNVTTYALNEQYTPFGYGAILPVVSVLSPESNRAYNVSNASLTFTVNRKAVWLGYSLDGQENVTITGNTTLSGLPNGLHNIAVYARDEFENNVVSETISFTVDVPFPIILIIAATGISVAVVTVGLLVYFKKMKRSAKAPFWSGSYLPQIFYQNQT